MRTKARRTADPGAINVERWTALGNGWYRIFGRTFVADVRLFHDGQRWVCNVQTCNNHMINAWELSGQCVRVLAPAEGGAL